MGHRVWGIWILALFLSLTSVRAERSSGGFNLPRNLGRVKQFLLDPRNPNRGWVVTNSGVLFNTNVETSSRWITVFNRSTFRKLTGIRARRGLKFLKIYASAKRKGNVFLLVENRQGSSHIFFSPNYGTRWRYMGMRKPGGGVQKPGEESASSDSSGGGSEGGAIDLSSLNESSDVAETPSTDSDSSSSGSSGYKLGAGASAPIFKAYFDIILHFRPGRSPWTFDTYHTLLLMDIIPKPGILFSFEVNPSPRFFQLELELSEMFTLITGKMQIPFDDMTPHNMFGGYLNNNDSKNPNAPAFLPDIWADLGIGVKMNIIESASLDASAWIYVVNGFQDGGTDPKGQVASYPSFGPTLPIEDNNSDKAIGGRVKATFFKMFTFGLSLYNGRYTPDNVESKRITLIGLDGSVRLKSKTEIRVGYLYGSIELLDNPDQDTTFLRAGLYGRVRQRFGDWYADFQAGILQTDSRVTDSGDQANVGGRLGYDARIFDVSLHYRYDLNDVPGKIARSYTGIRFIIKM